MNIVREFFKEVLGMFLADARLTVAILVLVSLAGILTAFEADPFVSGGMLLTGSLVILVATACRGVRGGAHR
jgi:hypothetical protein